MPPVPLGPQQVRRRGPGLAPTASPGPSAGLGPDLGQRSGGWRAGSGQGRDTAPARKGEGKVVPHLTASSPPQGAPRGSRGFGMSSGSHAGDLTAPCACRQGLRATCPPHLAQGKATEHQVPARPRPATPCGAADAQCRWPCSGPSFHHASLSRTRGPDEDDIWARTSGSS